MNKSLNQDIFLRLLHPQNASLSHFWPIYRPKGQISLLFHILQLLKSLPLSLKKVPISDGASPYRLLEGVSPGVPKEHGRLQSSGDFIKVKLFNT